MYSLLLRMLVAGKKSLFDYTVAYIKIFKPRFVFTFLDNNVDFYKLCCNFSKGKIHCDPKWPTSQLCKSNGLWFF